MSEYKENTVGWWLSQLKEPLKSRALGIVMDTSHPCDNLDDALTSVLNCLIEGSIMWTYWQGVYVYYFGGFHISGTNFKDGYDLAYECDPWRGSKEIIDSPAPEVWGEKIPIGKFGGFFKGVEADVKILISPEEGYVDAPNLTSEEVLNLTTKPIEIGRKSSMQDWYDQLPPAREIEAPERAVVGYEEPKPIDTIEKKHELKIQNLELAKYHQGKEIENLQARVEQLEGVVGKLEQQIEYVYRNLPKDFDGTR